MNDKQALAGLRVLELTEFDAGAACGEMLAWLGADVVKVELPRGKRRYADGARSGADSHEFIFLNANKRSVACDFESQQGREDLKKLIARADVVIEQLLPGRIESMGCGYDAVQALNPGVVYAQVKAFPSGGPREKYIGVDAVALSAGGVVAGTGYVGGPPLKPGAAIADIGSALHCTMGILAALHQRGSTGRGQRVETPMQGAVINLNRTAYVGQILRGKPMPRMGNTSRSNSVPSNLYPCKPGGPNDHVFVNISNSANSHWLGLLDALGRTDLKNDPAYATSKARNQRRDEIDRMVAEWCRGRTKTEAMTAVQEAGAPAGAVLDADDLGADPHLRKRGMFVAIEHPAHGELAMPGWPVKMSESQVPIRRAPLLGEHTEEVLREWLALRTNTAGGRQAAKADSVATGALAGVRVVDLTQLEAGPSCTEALAWLGADVVKIEEPKRGERARQSNTEQPGVDAVYFIVLNANKRSLRCDIKSEQGRELLQRLIANADVVVENMAPGSIERLGYGYDVARELNPRIIYAQVKGFAADGPQARYVCFDMIAQAVAGSMSITGADGREPIKPGANIGDTGAGIHCAVGVLAALYQRQRTGRGQRIQVAMQDAVLNFCRTAFARHAASGMEERRGYDDLYRCKGEGVSDYCYVDTSDVERRRRVLAVIGAPDSQCDAATVKRMLTAWCSEHCKTDVMDAMQRAGIAAGAVFDTKELIDDPQLRESGIFAHLEHPVRGAFVMPAWPVRLSDSQVPTRCSPLLGTHTGAVLSEWLGMSAQEIEDYQQSLQA